LARRVGEVILAAQHQADPHTRIVDGIREEEGRGTIGPAHHEIANVIALEALRSVNEIHELEPLTRWHGKAQRRRDTRGETPGALGLGELATGAPVARRAAGGELRTARELELQRRAEARIDCARTLERHQILCVERCALRLPVGPALVLAVGTRIPLDAEPA